MTCLDETPYYHVTSRCVRRAFLCGFNRCNGKSYEDRRVWIGDRIRMLSSLFNINLCAYAVMSNHYHLVVRLNPDGSASWSDNEVLNHWTSLFHGPLLVQRYCAGEPLNQSELAAVAAIAAVYRARLGDLSWFMKCLNDPIARQANAEDCCTGRLWEAPFIRSRYPQIKRSPRDGPCGPQSDPGEAYTNTGGLGPHQYSGPYR